MKTKLYAKQTDLTTANTELTRIAGEVTKITNDTNLKTLIKTNTAGQQEVDNAELTRFSNLVKNVNNNNNSQLQDQLTQAQQERDNYKGELEKQQENHKDCANIKSERDRLQQELVNKEKELLQHFIQELNLALTTGTITKEQVLQVIKEKIKNSPGNSGSNADLTAQIDRLKQEITELKNSKITSEVVRDKFETVYSNAGITVSASMKDKIDSTSSAEEKLGLKLDIMNEEIQKEKKQKDMAKRMNIIFGLLSVFSLLTVAFLLVKKVILPGSELGPKKKINK
ncbi:11253_t:CDS:2 [Entrophospora sp. SA101]|nr:11253_t:CDS:2 [Entrophospora sp. SA101]